MSFHINIEHSDTVKVIEMKQGVLGYSKYIGPKNYVHAPVVEPMAIDFPNMKYGYVKFAAGQKPEYLLKPIAETWEDEENTFLLGDGYRRIYTTPILTKELPLGKQEMHLTVRGPLDALNELHDQYEAAIKHHPDVIPLVTHEVDDFGKHTFSLKSWMPRTVERFGPIDGQEQPQAQPTRSATKQPKVVEPVKVAEVSEAKASRQPELSEDLRTRMRGLVASRDKAEI